MSDYMNDLSWRSTDWLNQTSGWPSGAPAAPKGQAFNDWWYENSRDIARTGMGLGGMMAGQAASAMSPKQTGWGYMNYINPATGDNNVNALTQGMWGNMNNMMQGTLGPNGYSPQAVEQLWLQNLPGLNTAAANMTGDFNEALNANVRRLVAPTMEAKAADYGGQGALYSGAAMQGISDATTKLGYDAMIAQQQARLGLLSPWSQQSYTGLQQGYGNVYNMMGQYGAPDLIAPTLLPTYGNGSFNPQEGQQGGGFGQGLLKFGQGALSGAGMGASLGPWGALAGGILGGLGSLFM